MDKRKKQILIIEMEKAKKRLTEKMKKQHEAMFNKLIKQIKTIA